MGHFPISIPSFKSTVAKEEGGPNRAVSEMRRRRDKASTGAFGGFHFHSSLWQELGCGHSGPKRAESPD